MWKKLLLWMFLGLTLSPAFAGKKTAAQKLPKKTLAETHGLKNITEKPVDAPVVQAEVIREKPVDKMGTEKKATEDKASAVKPSDYVSVIPAANIKPTALESSATVPATAVSKYSLLTFRGGAIGVIQKGRQVYSLFLSWNPEWQLNSNMALGLNLGGTILETVTSKNFNVLEYQVSYRWQSESPIGAEVGFGAQSWVSTGGTHLLVSGNLIYAVPTDGALNRIFVGYSGFFLPKMLTSQIKVGAGLNF